MENVSIVLMSKTPSNLEGESRFETRAQAAPDHSVVVRHLRTADDSRLVATGSAEPQLSWRLASDRPKVRQLSYEIQVASDPAFTIGVTSSALISSPQVVNHPWPASPLRSREVRWWRVRVLTDLGLTAWSEPVRAEAALLDASDWIAHPIRLSSEVGHVPLFRREFDLESGVQAARLYVSALGVHDVQINGQPVSDDLLEPGWTSYGHRLLYATYDVTALLTTGTNAISAAVGDGWYRGKLGRRRNVYGKSACFLAQLEVRLTDDSTVKVATDDRWRGSTGAMRGADLYDGVEVDLRLEPDGWRRPGFTDRSWQSVRTVHLSASLVQRSMPPVGVIEILTPLVESSGGGLVRVDAAQNLTGYLRIRATGAAGARVTVQHAEVLDGEGRLHTAPLRGARATDSYVLANGQPTVLEPRFTFHGFRYAEIVAPDVSIDSVEVVVVASDLTWVGEFECSNPLVNQLFSNIRWSQRANFLSIPTDCPQRDERLGWTGDIQVFSPTACANADSRAFLANWLVDLALDQRSDGSISNVVPNVLPGEAFGAAGWGDAATVVPWNLYEAYGDHSLLKRQYPSMKAWVDWAASRRGEDGTWTGDAQFGDWLDPGAPPDKPGQATTSADFIATSYLSHSAGILARTARILGLNNDAQHYVLLRDQAAAAAWRRWSAHAVTTQTGCAIALELGVAPPGQRGQVADALAALVRGNGGRIGTGFLGTALILPALTAAGHIAEAYQLLSNRECPGWLYQVLMGATTMWERWDAIRPDGSIYPGNLRSAAGASMLSFNHYAYGAVGAWLYRSLAGLAPDPDDPGYSTVVMAPVPGGGVTWARARIETPYGATSISWTCEDSSLLVDLHIPPGARGRFIKPPGSWRFAAGEHLDNSPELMLLSGTHRLALTK